jgi:hypothetical protein
MIARGDLVARLSSDVAKWSAAKVIAARRRVARTQPPAMAPNAEADRTKSQDEGPEEKVSD